MIRPNVRAELPAHDPVASAAAGAAAWTHALLTHRDALVDALVAIATRKSAEDEVHRSLDALAGVERELLRTRPAPVDQIAVFLPSNNVLYSYVLLAVVPSFYARRVVVRPSSRVDATAARIHALLATASANGGEIVLRNLRQSAFVDAYCAGSDAVVFTGRYDNALGVARHCRSDALFVAFGSGANAVVIGPDADTDRAVRDVVRARTYNSGQDCLCPDLILADAAVYDRVAQTLREAVAALKTGPLADPETDVGPLAYEDAFRGAARFIGAHRDRIVAGGATDHAAMSVEPTLVLSDFDPARHTTELFSPVFDLQRYADPNGIREWLCSPAQLGHGMYLSAYGEPRLREEIVGTTVVLRDVTALDAEDGNEPLGGFGVRANFVATRRRIEARPLLLSAEIAARRVPPESR